MKHLNQFITEYIVKKKLDKFIDSEDHYEYFPERRSELIKILKDLVSKKVYDFNCINTSKITDMSNVFNNDIFYNISFDVSDWDVSNVKNMSHMFRGCELLNCDLSNWYVGNVLDMTHMFDGCTYFNG